MLNLLHAEFYRLKKAKAFWICLLVTTLCAVFLGVLTNGIAKGEMDIPVSSLSGLSDIFIMSVIGTLLASILICSDFDSKNIHDAVSRGRMAIVASKCVSFVIVIALLVLPYALVSFIGFATQGKFAGVLSYSTYLILMANQAGVAVEAASIGKAVEMLLISMLLYAARLSICIPFAFKIKKSVVVTVIGVVFGFVSDFIYSVLCQIPVFETILDFTPFAHPILTLDMSQGEMLKILGVSIGFIVFIGVLTYWLFRKDEIK